jgi:hypothetical protein
MEGFDVVIGQAVGPTFDSDDGGRTDLVPCSGDGARFDNRYPAVDEHTGVEVRGRRTARQRSAMPFLDDQAIAIPSRPCEGYRWHSWIGRCVFGLGAQGPAAVHSY